MEPDITEWFSELSSTERKSLLCDLHTARTTNKLKDPNLLIKLIYKLEELHDEVKKASRLSQ